MSSRINIRKILFITMWVIIGSGMIALLVLAANRQRNELCRSYLIDIKEGERFVTKASVTKLIRNSVKGNITGTPKVKFDLLKIEQLLEDNVWVKDAQVYFDNKNVLHVAVEERKPIARVFALNNSSFYLDNENKMLPLSERFSTTLPVFTGFPGKKSLNAKDSLLLSDISSIATYITAHAFWAAQVAQVDIISCGAACWDFEMIPLVGNHTVRLGDGKDIDKKFNRLYSFYQQVLSKAGFNKYKSIDVQYAGQVVAAKSTANKIDSIQFRKNVMEMLKQAREMQTDSLYNATTKTQ